MMFIRKRSLVIILVFICLLSVGTGLVISRAVQASGDDSVYLQLQALQEILAKVRDSYVEEVDQSTLIEGAIEGVLDKLDPHSTYIKPQHVSRTMERFKGDFEGIGIQFDVRNDYLTVIAPIEGSPAEKVGVRAGDRIVKIDGQSAIGIKEQEVVAKLRGPKGTPVTVTIVRSGVTGAFDRTIVRDKIPIHSVPYWFVVRPGIGYVRITRFSENTTSELDKALGDLEGQGIGKLIVDLRWNPGGLLAQAVEVADEFVDEGVIVYTTGRIPSANEEYYATKTRTHREYPLIVMVNHGSASASEIVSGAVQDLDRGLVVGQTTFGKGLVQHPYDLRNNGKVLLTIARYYTPLGRLIQRPYSQGRAAYLQQGYDDVDPNAETDTSSTGRPVYVTSGGRKTYGGGGITPDVILRPDTLSALVDTLLVRNVCFDFAGEYVGRHGSDIAGSFDAYSREFSLTESDMTDFESFLRKRGVNYKVQDLSRDLPIVRRLITQEIAGIVWGARERARVGVEGDREILDALKLFPQATAVLAHRDLSKIPMSVQRVAQSGQGLGTASPAGK